MFTVAILSNLYTSLVSKMPSLIKCHFLDTLVNITDKDSMGLAGDLKT